MKIKDLNKSNKLHHRLIHHVFIKHRPVAVTIVVVLLLINVLPNSLVKSISTLNIGKLKQISYIGTVDFQGEGSSKLNVFGEYSGKDKKVYEVIVNEDSKTFKLLENGNVINDNLDIKKQDHKIIDGLNVSFDPKVSYASGNTWVISTGVSSGLNVVSDTVEQTSQKVATLFGVNRNGTGTSQFAFNQPRGDSALFDIQIGPAVIHKNNNFSILIILIFGTVFPLVMILVIHFIRRWKHNKIINENN